MSLSKECKIINACIYGVFLQYEQNHDPLCARLVPTHP